ncbi:MAG: hypothetical protein KBG10_08440 [Anaerolineaceae bacterium]|nr:hypothetical protein [Anaerolineaceae bacterium]
MVDPEIDFILQRILRHQSQEGPFQVLVNINPTYGGTGEDQWSWMLCDAPLVLYILLKFGMSCNDERIRKAKDYLVSLVRENGWPCSVAPDLGKFRGPGRKADPCLLATLQMLKVLALIPNADPQIVRTGIEMILGMWEKRREQKHYLFAMGTDLNKLKASLIWFDILQYPGCFNSISIGYIRPPLARNACCSKSKIRCKWSVYSRIHLDGLERMGFWTKETTITVVDFLGVKGYEAVKLFTKLTCWVVFKK